MPRGLVLLMLVAGLAGLACVDLERPPGLRRCGGGQACLAGQVCGDDGWCRPAPPDASDDGPADAPDAGDGGGEISSEPMPVCNEATQDGCTAPLKCSLDCEMKAIACVKSGAKKVDETCSNDFECTPGSMCICTGMGCVCKELCRAHTDCPGSQSCIGTVMCPGDPSGTTRVKFCV